VLSVPSVGTNTPSLPVPPSVDRSNQTYAKKWTAAVAGGYLSGMEVFENYRGHLPDFIRLNERWIRHYFQLEEADRVLAAAPERVIEQGGFVFSLVERGEVAGVCALFNKGDGVFELARMAVDPAHQGQGYGDVLMEAALARLTAIGARKVQLLSNTSLEAAIRLYKKHGFATVSTEQHPVYKRCNIVMERVLRD
jgi:ribosomal protein S18 acetylase RimI-like enzyme